MSTEAFLKGNETDYNSKSKMKSQHQPQHDESIKETVHDLGKRVGEKATQMVNTGSDRLQQSRQYVKRHPTTGVLMAAAAGLAIGSLLTVGLRRRS